jgi:chromate transporter
MSAVTTDTNAAPPAIPFAEALAVWIKVGLFSFGGAAGQIAMLHTIIVDEKKWLDEKRFLHALNYCTLLPGPEAQQLATYIGWLLHGVRGGLVAGLLFVVPGALVVLGLTMLYVAAKGVPLVEGIFFGIKAAVLVIVVQALLKMAKRVGHTPLLYGLMVASFLAILVLKVPYPAIVAGAALAGALFVHPKIESFAAPAAAPGRLGRTLGTIAVWSLVWWAPVVIAALALGQGHVLTEIGLFFSKLAVVTFGGAYALLVWLAQAAVEQKQWLTAPEMADGLGLAETTPGPTILVTQFVGFLAAYRLPQPFSPMVAGILGALMTTWVTFAPSFLWIFAGAPYVEDLRANRRLAGALQGITAAVIGVIAYLAVWFGLHVLFGQVGEASFGPLHLPTIDLRRLDGWATGLAIAAFILAFRFKIGMIAIVGIMAALGVAVKLTLG